MRSLPTSVLNLLDEGRISLRGLIRFEFGTGTYGFIKAATPFIYNGLSYQPGAVINVSDISSVLGLSAQQFTVSLAASSDDGLTPAVLRTIEAEDYRDRPVTIYDAYFHPDTNEFLYMETMRRGYVDTISHKDTKDTGYTITMNCESRALDYTRTNGRKRSDIDQARRNSNDRFYAHASLRGREEILWGQAGATPQAQTVDIYKVNR